MNSYTVKARPAGTEQEFWVTTHGGLGITKTRAVRFDEKADASAFARTLRQRNGDLVEFRVAAVRD